MTTLGLTQAEFDRVYGTLTSRLGKGQISEEDYWTLFLQYTGRNFLRPFLPKGESLFVRKFKELLTIDTNVLQIAEEVKGRQYRVPVASNTIASHATVLKEQGVYSHFSPLFLSFERGNRKPDEAFFADVAEELHLQPQQILLIDDDQRNIVAAQSFGIRTTHFKNPQQLREALQELHILPVRRG